jgi:hypothetical protein
MTVQQLIDELVKVEDKTRDVWIEDYAKNRQLFTEDPIVIESNTDENEDEEGTWNVVFIRAFSQ